MRWVDQAITRPFRCAVVPYVGNGSGHSFIDTGQDLDLEHVYISDVAAEAIAQMAGWVPGYQFQQAEAQIAELNERIDALEAELAEADDFKNHMDGLMKHGYVPKRAAGRPPKKTDKAAA